MPSQIGAHRHGIEQALDAFSALQDFFRGAIIVDAQSRITWIDQRYRELLKLGVDFNPVGMAVEEVIPHSLMRRVVDTGKPILVATELAVADPENAGPAAVRASGRLCYASANRAVTALEHLWRRAQHRQRRGLTG